MHLVVHQIHSHGPDVRELRLRRPDGGALPAWPAGAHLRVVLPDVGGPPLTRHYSLIGPPGDTPEYRIAVLRDPASRGGSARMHALAVGDALEVDAPVDGFPLAPRHAGRILLVAGGIGITPLHAMAHALNAQGLHVELHVLARSAERLVLLDELRALQHVDLHLHPGPSRPDLSALVGAASVGAQLYACGPAGLLQALRDTAARQGWPPESLHMESFGARAASTDRPIRLHLAQSGLTLDVAPGTSLLQALIDAEQFVAYDCQRGECGQCWTAVVEGEPDHRDVCLTPAQRAHGLCPCVSWARSEVLTLDL